MDHTLSFKSASSIKIFSLLILRINSSEIFSLCFLVSAFLFNQKYKNNFFSCLAVYKSCYLLYLIVNF